MRCLKRLLSSLLGLFVLTVVACGAEDRATSGDPGAKVAESSIAGAQRGQLSAEPNPIQVCDGSDLGVTTVQWQTDEVGGYEIRIGTKLGPLFAEFQGAGSAQTEKWVTSGMKFVAVEKESAEVLDTLRVELTPDGCD